MAQKKTPKKRPAAVFVVGAVLLALVVVLIFVVRARSAKQADAARKNASAKLAKAAQSASSSGAEIGSGMPPGMAGPGMGMVPGMGTRGIPAAAEAGPTLTKPYPGQKEPNRPDPFASQPQPPRPPPEPVVPVLPVVMPMPNGIRIEGVGEVQVVALRRTAGLLWNQEAYGLLEMGGEYYVVRPGDPVGEYQVSAITRDAIVLYSPSLGKNIRLPLQGPRATQSEQVGSPPPAEVPALRTRAAGARNEQIAPGVPEFPPF